MNYKISIIVPFFYKEKKLIGVDTPNFDLLSFNKCLSAIFKLKYKNYEVILVSDNSSQSSIELTKKYPCKLVKLKNNNGAANARNQGAKLASGQILVFLDSDVEIKDNSLTIINNYNNIKNNEGILQGVYSHKPNYNSMTQYVHSYQCYHVFFETKKKKYTETLCTCFVAIKKKYFFKVKGFNSNFSGAETEDLDLGYRLMAKNHKIQLEKKLRTIHHTNYGILYFIKKIVSRHTSEMKMYLRNKKDIIKRTQQLSHTPVLLSIILIAIKTLIIFGNFFYKIPNFNEIFITLILLFILTNIKFLKFLLNSKGFLVALRSLFYMFFHFFLLMICIVFGILDFYVLRNKY
jgi:glycosyltransferase involved in cell wall biosynthesis